ncbi:Flp family type IVb pilin [Actinomyces wuliandei]|uniref:Flp family type IVb pilin n=1 Tax=Actinomyces wuliandei TaxID=2057743 RepID=UPI001FA97842|nr:hypothetical protein [Actinomyces wuliandei]
MSNSLLRLQVRIQQTFADLRDERGQSMVEYAGIALVVAAIVGAVINAIGSDDGGIGGAITRRIQEVINDIGNGD